MLEIKVQCDCGQKYKFDVEPVDGRMPFVVNCPICGSNGTEKANQILSQIVPRQTAPAPAAIPALALAAPPAVAAPPPGAASLTPSVPAGPTRLRINLHKPDGATASLAPAATQAPAAPPPMPATPRPAMRPPAPAAAPAKTGKPPSFALGVVGGLIGSLVGSLIYFAIFKYADFQFKLMAVGVGYLAGAGAELLGRKEGSKELGVIAAVLTLIGIVGAQYFVALGWWRAGSDDLTSHKGGSAYEESVSEAKKVVAAIPTGSDQEIRIYLAKEETKDSGEKIDPKSITADEIKAFKEDTLPSMQNLASGKLTKAEFEKQNGIDEAKAKKEADADEGTFKAVFLLLLLNRFNLVSLCAAAGLAFKLSANA